MTITHTHILIAAAALSVALGAVYALPAEAQEVLPRPAQPFKGKIGRTAKDSTPDFPKGITAPKGAPNVLLIMTDDVGFGALLPKYTCSTYFCPPIVD